MAGQKQHSGCRNRLADPAFVEKFKMLDAVSDSEFHIYRVSDLVLPRQAIG